MKAHLSRRWHFAASHRLHVDVKGEAWNVATFGKCNNPHGHGHNYTVQVTVSGEIDPVTGMVVNLADLDAFAQRELLDVFDHRNLNSLECFRDQVPSTENLAFELWRVFDGFLEQHPRLTLECIRVEETGNNSFDYFGEGAPVRHDE